MFYKNLYSNQPVPFDTAQPPGPTTQSSSRVSSSFRLDQSRQPASFAPQDQLPRYGSTSAVNYVPPAFNQFSPSRPARSNSGSVGGGIEKTNTMSTENPFRNPAHSYEQSSAARTVTSITSAPKSGGAISKSLHLSSENPFNSMYTGYQRPSRVDTSKRISQPATPMRSIDNKSMNLSDENPFFSIYGHHQNPSSLDAQRRSNDLPKSTAPFLPINTLPPASRPLSNYQPSTIREYSSGTSSAMGSSSFPTSISDWTRTHPAPLSYRPMPVQRPPPDTYSTKASLPAPSYAPSISKPPPPPPLLTQSASLRSPPLAKTNSAGPPDKTSLNMSPDNPFAATYGRYYYPSNDEIKAQKRVGERRTRFAEPPSVDEHRTAPQSNRMSEYPDTETKEVISGKGGTKFTRLDIDF